jgi:ankyrin repeat protein
MRWLHEEGGIDLTDTDSLGQTAVHIAARRGNLDALRWLGGHGCRMWEEDAAGRTPLMHAQGADQRATSSFLEHAPRECT